MTSLGGIREGRLIQSPLRERVDVVVVGSGASGAVVARELSAAGRSVIVLEEGPHVPSRVYGGLPPSASLRYLAREAGLGAALGLGETPFISTLSGKCVGGSSVLTGGVCFRIPEDVLLHWTRVLGLEQMSPSALDEHFASVEQRIHVETVPEKMRSRSTELFVEGARAMGIQMKSLRRNTRQCRGASRCNFGCPHGAKMSVDVSYLPDAVARGATIFSDALVDHITVTGGRATGVTGRFLDPESRRHRIPFEIRAKCVVVACGTMHTPVLLRASGLASRHLGRHVTMHPAFRVSALFEEEVAGWDGALQSVYSDDFHHEGITLVGVFSPINVLAAALPGVGHSYRAIAEQSRHLAVFGGMIHDAGGGTVRRTPFREPVLTYRMEERDRRRLLRGMQILGQMAFAAGAKKVLLPLFGVDPIERTEDLEFLLSRPPPLRRVECMAFHPLGSARMSQNEDDGIVQPNGETWGVDNLYVADGSVLPTSIGVNSQLPIMAIATMLTRGIEERWREIERKA